MKLVDFFKNRGYDITDIINYHNQGNDYLSWYKGFVDKFQVLSKKS